MQITNSPPQVSKPQVKRTRVPQRAFAVVAMSLVVLGVLLLSAGAAVRVVDCRLCHTMRPYVEAHADSGHAGLECADCHANRSFTGLLTDGVRAARWVAFEPFVLEPPVAMGSDARCRGCHAEVLEQVIVRSVRVRHADFAEESCATCHSGSAHEVDTRRYVGSQMDDCMSCHRASIQTPGTCETCHPPETQKGRRDRPTAWRASHGPGWESAHGMGELTGCPACHTPPMCAKCHGMPLPHPPTWSRVHGRELRSADREKCYTCHDSEWCASCHGVDMPHQEGFLRVHGPEAKDKERVCTKCHSVQNCDACHAASGHQEYHTVGQSPVGQGDVGGDTDAR